MNGITTETAYVAGTMTLADVDTLRFVAVPPPLAFETGWLDTWTGGSTG